MPGCPPNNKVSPSNRKAKRVIEYVSQRLTPAKSWYNNFEGEAFTVVKALKETQVTILESVFPIMVYTEHSVLTTLLSSDWVNGRIGNWQTQVAEYDLCTVHIPGKNSSWSMDYGKSQLRQYTNQKLKSRKRKECRGCTLKNMVERIQWSDNFEIEIRR